MLRGNAVLREFPAQARPWYRRRARKALDPLAIVPRGENFIKLRWFNRRGNAQRDLAHDDRYIFRGIMDLENIALLYVICGLERLTVLCNAAMLECFVRLRAALRQPRYLHEFV